VIRDSREQLAAGAAELGLHLDRPAVNSLVGYLELLDKWNRVYNLTAIRQQEKWVTHHLLDSLAILAHLPAGQLLDVGSGAGFPGIPVAVAQPQRKVTLLDSNQKKGAFLRQAAAELGLTNVQVATERMEAHHPQPGYEVIVSRAFSDLPKFARLCGHALAHNGVLAAMKGVLPHAEIAELPPDWNASDVRTLRIPGLGGARHLVLMRRQDLKDGRMP
jgi:16S rRNA (guanine527-N7)-methyltransferase